MSDESERIARLEAEGAALRESLEWAESWIGYALPILRTRHFPPAEQLDDGHIAMEQAQAALKDAAPLAAEHIRQPEPQQQGGRAEEA